jgi:hypothetical protein
MKYTRIIATPDGSSRFEDAELQTNLSTIAEGVPPLRVTGPIGTSAALFLEDPGDAPEYEFRNPPMRVLVVITAGRISVETGDGDRREFGVGNLISVEDTTGKGHLSAPLTSGVRMVMLLPEADPS